MPKVCPNCELTYSDDDFFCAADGSPLRSTSAEPDNLVGTVIADRYRVEAILGEGGMGRVYRARHVRVPREAAIKVLRRALLADSYAIAAFNREARNAASVGDHPNVAAVYDFGETADGLVFLAMEFIEGETLTKRLEREPVLPPARAVEIVRQIAAGLTAAHELPEPVVHRDLKPDNILLKATRDGSDWVKIVDFGIAKAAKRDTQMLTTPGLVVGTPRYMSPEQLTGGAIDARSDIYALGIIAFQILTGRMPFPSSSRDEESTIQWALQRLTSQPMALSQVRADIQWPAAAQDAMQRALATAASDRIGTATGFASALARAFGLTTPSSVVGVVTSAPGPLSSALEAAARAAAPTAPLAAATAPIPVSAPVTLRSSDVVGPSAGAAPARAQSEPRRSRLTATIAGGALVVAAIVAGLVWQRAGNVNAGSATPNDTSGGLAAPPRSDSQPAAAPDTQGVAAAAVDSTSRAPVPAPTTPNPARPTTPPNQRAPGETAVASAGASERARAALDSIKSALEDPDAVATGGRGDALLRDIARLLPTLTTRADSVEASYYAVETNLALDKPAEACRLLTRLRDKARGSPFEGNIERFLNDAELDCANR